MWSSSRGKRDTIWRAMAQNWQNSYGAVSVSHQMKIRLKFVFAKSSVICIQKTWREQISHKFALRDAPFDFVLENWPKTWRSCHILAEGHTSVTQRDDAHIIFSLPYLGMTSPGSESGISDVSSAQWRPSRLNISCLFRRLLFRFLYGV